MSELVITAADAELELAIDIEITRCMEAPTRDERANAFERAQELHALRRPEIVAYLEQRKGLRK